jgi:glycosyltransferase involved in cell wall biosynthesis
MDTKRIVHIGYGGSLSAWTPGKSAARFTTFLHSIIGPYLPDNINSATRSGYYLFQAIKYFKEKYPELAPHLRVDLWGAIASGNSEQVKAMGIDDIVTISGYLSKNESLSKLNRCDVLFLPLESEKQGQKPLMVPGKLYEMLHIGKPILALAGKSDCYDILSRSGVGVLCSPFDYPGIAEVLAKIVSDPEAFKDSYKVDSMYVDQFSYKNRTALLAGFFNQVLSK